MITFFKHPVQQFLSFDENLKIFLGLVQTQQKPHRLELILFILLSAG